MKSFLLFLCWSSVLPLAVAQTAPVIATHPTHQAVAPGSPVTLSVAATGTAPLTRPSPGAESRRRVRGTRSPIASSGS
jgi:hypothetical protein